MMEWSQPSQAQRNAFIWFTESQLRVVIRNGVVPEWFHGIISRKIAEDLLMSKPPGYFLIRVSESRIGYTLSYRAGDRCRHFMIDVLEDGQYIIVGEDRPHRSLQDLVDFHRRTPIMPFNEVLTVACGQTSNDKTDYAELLFPQRHQNPNTRWLPNNPLHPSVGQPASPEDIPPALPYRPNNFRNPADLSLNRLYPNLEEEFPNVTSPLSTTPVPKKRYKDFNLPPNQPPEVPARSCVPPLKQNQACIRTVSAPESAPTTTAHPKPSVVSNLKNLKKKFQKKAGTMQEATENDYEEIAGDQTFSAPPFFYNVTDGALPQEYLPPPPFAPGHY
ncbi:hematopoietic SH2 domain-containing protein homolog [Plectropomus leopardus]|uniref:hematopoietic SH2 domain-containing protein homolog n=1 Tax=Plectropomus leopardus TaxID=160734 RepID=UPI001C4CF419|nr:hematopoietic SH2 domain-containing protein homolog [Plectropomus leopardus]